MHARDYLINKTVHYNAISSFVIYLQIIFVLTIRSSGNLFFLSWHAADSGHC